MGWGAGAWWEAPPTPTSNQPELLHTCGFHSDKGSAEVSGLTAQTVLGLHACLLLDSLAPVPVSDIPQSRPGKVDMCGLNRTQGHPVCYNASLVGCLAGVEKTEGQHLARPSQRVRGHGVHIYGAPQVEEN